MGYPSVVDGTVYVEELDWDESGHLDALDAVTGTQKWSSTYQSQWSIAGAPLVVGTTVYIDGGDNGLWAYSTIDGSFAFSVTPLDQWRNTRLRVFQRHHLHVHEQPLSSARRDHWRNALDDDDTWWNARIHGKHFTGVRSDPRLRHLQSELGRHRSLDAGRRVDAAGTYTGTPAFADGVVYGLSGGNLIARDAATGNLLWAFGGDGTLGASLFNQPTVANGYVYASSANNVYAVNIATHHSDWTAPVGGWLAIASGRLVVSSANGTLYGFVLTQ